MFKRTHTLLLALVASMAIPAQAATINFTSDLYNQTGSGFGNVLDYYGDGVEVSAWANTGVPHGTNNQINTAQIKVWSTGLGSCNQDELANCSDPEHQVDNVGDDDLVLFVFDRVVEFGQIRINPFGEHDRDVSFWVANLSTPVDLTGWTSSSLRNGSSAFGTRHNNNNGVSDNAKWIPLLGLQGNALLFGGKFNSNDSNDNDYFKIEKLTYEEVVVPVPAAIWLFASGLLGLVSLARKAS